MSTSAVKVPSVRFSVDEDDKLIEFVSKRPILYHQGDSEFKNNVKKDLMWEQVGKAINRTGAECKKRWKSVRDHYRREKKEGPTGAVAKKKRAIYWGRLKFLDGVEDETDREDYTNVQDDSINNEPLTWTIETDPILVEEDDDVAEIIEPIKPPPPPPPPTKESYYKSKRKQESIAFSKFLKEKKEDREHLKRCLEKLVAYREEENDIDLFFKSMAATVKKFRPDLAISAKAKICQLVTDFEMQNHQSSS